MEQTKKIPKCLNPSCLGLPVFENWEELAHHIVENKKTHPRSSLIFAYHVLSEVDDKKEFKPRSPMSEETRQILKDCVRELSGNMEMARTVCPNCKKVTEQRIEVEYLQDRSWRNSNGTLVVNCLSCKRER